ncbi:hypothetical protein ACSUZJ_09905 [Telluria sp. B2]
MEAVARTAEQVVDRATRGKRFRPRCGEGAPIRADRPAPHFLRQLCRNKQQSAL